MPVKNSSIFVFLLLFSAHILCTARLNAAPLESGFALAPSSSATPKERADAYKEARSRVLAAAAKYEKTPYRYGGTDKNGIDCSGLIYVSFRDALGVTVPRTAATLHTWAEKIKFEDAQAGDLLFFVTGGGGISHVAIFVGGRRFIHAASDGPSTGVIYSTIDESYWSRTFASAGRAFPAGSGSGTTSTTAAAAPQAADSGKDKQVSVFTRPNYDFLVGIGGAPNFNIPAEDGKVIKGGGGQIMFGFVAESLSMVFGIEARPEWDSMLGFFSVPVTLSLGADEKFRIFGGGGPAFNNPNYPEKIAWLGSFGLTLAPFVLDIGKTSWAPYAEAAWQPYFTKNGESDKEVGLSDFRFSLGLNLAIKL